MPHIPPAPVNNRLLAALPDKDSRRFQRGCETVDLLFAEILSEPGEHIRHVYFPTESFISLVGNEGMLGASLALGIDVSPLQAIVQGKGAALRMDSDLFCRELGRSPALQHQRKLYLNVMLGQLAQTAACTRFHVVESRLARWLLMTHDRAHSDEFHVTHEYLAFMLGVRRVGVTKAATALQNRKLISYHRGDVKILDRRGLEESSCSCYRADIATYAETMDSQPPRRKTDAAAIRSKAVIPEKAVVSTRRGAAPSVPRQ